MQFKTLILSSGLLALGASLSAQAPAPVVKKSSQMHDVEIIDVQGNVITFEEGGVVKQWKAPEGQLFNVDGKPVPATTLLPGTKVSALVYSTTTTIPASKVVSYKSAKVAKISGRTVVVELESGKYQSVKVKKGQTFMVEGKRLSLADLRVGMKVTQKIVTETTPTIVTEMGMGTAATPPATKKP